MKTFVIWKEDKIKEEGFRRPDKYWYYDAYGKYCNKFRKTSIGGVA